MPPGLGLFSLNTTCSPLELCKTAHLSHGMAALREPSVSGRRCRAGRDSGPSTCAIISRPASLNCGAFFMGAFASGVGQAFPAAHTSCWIAVRQTVHPDPARRSAPRHRRPIVIGSTDADDPVSLPAIPRRKFADNSSVTHEDRAERAAATAACSSEAGTGIAGPTRRPSGPNAYRK